MKLFIDVVEDKFFLPFTNKGKRLYEEVIFSIFKWVEELDEYGENDREIIIQKITEYLDRQLEANVFDEAGNLINGDTRQRAQAILRYLIECRWIFEESKGNGIYSINFYEHSYKVISMMKAIKEDKPNSYQSEMRTILNNMEIFDTYDIDRLVDIHDAVESLSNMLKSLRSNINKYYMDIITDNNSENLRKIVESLNEYRIDFFDKAYFNFKTEFDSKNSIIHIINKIEDLYELGIERLLPSYKIKIDSKKSDEEILFIIDNMFTSILNKLRGMNTIIVNIEDKNNKYLLSLSNKIFYIINRGSDITGLLNKSISLTINDKLRDFSFINFTEQKHYNFEKMFFPKKKREKLDPVFTKEIIPLSEEEIIQFTENLSKSKKYIIKNINNYVLELLTNKNSCLATDIKLENDQDYIKILFIALYGFLNETDYYIELTGEKAYIDNIKFDDYIIYRKEKNNG